MFPSIPSHIPWHEPWQPILKGAESLAAELERELSVQHALYGQRVEAVGRRSDCDKVLFVTNDRSKPLVVVHLTWQVETEPDWPETTFYESWDSWLKQCLNVDE